MDLPRQINFPFKLGDFVQMPCTPWVRQEGHQESLRHNLSHCAF